MARAAKVPQSYHHAIADLQRIVLLTTKDPRLDIVEKAEVREHLQHATEALAKVSARPLPKEE